MCYVKEKMNLLHTVETLGIHSSAEFHATRNTLFEKCFVLTGSEEYFEEIQSHIAVY